MIRLLVKPRWLLRHLVVIALCVAFFFLSRWQLHRGEQTTGTVQNYGYAIEWLVFAGCVCFAWWRMLQDELHPDRVGKGRKRVNPWRTPGGEAVPQAGAAGAAAGAAWAGVAVAAAAPSALPASLVGAARRPGEVTTAEIDPDDAEVLAYNAYLAEYAARSGSKASR